MKIVTLSPNQFNKFSTNHKYRNYFQTSSYGAVMTKLGYNIHYLGIVSDTNKFMNNKIAYAPRGILCNYENKNDLLDMVKKIKQALSKQGFMILKINPNIATTIKDCNGTIMNFNNQSQKIVQNIKSAGFEYNSINTERSNRECLTILNNVATEMFTKLDKRTRNKIRRAVNYGIEAGKDKTQDIDRFYYYIKNETIHTKAYYQQLCEKFGNNIEIYYARINTEIFTVNSRKMYEKEVENNALLAELIQNNQADAKQRELTLNKKMESDKLLDTYKNSIIKATNLLKKYPKGITIASAMVLKYDNAAYLIAEGSDAKYKNQNPDCIIKWKMIEDYIKENIKYINWGELTPNLNPDNHSGQSIKDEKKLSFNSVITEYVGEFSIILNSFSYNLYKSFAKNKNIDSLFNY